jgi:hypothetical protein
VFAEYYRNAPASGAVLHVPARLDQGRKGGDHDDERLMVEPENKTLFLVMSTSILRRCVEANPIISTYSRIYSVVIEMVTGSTSGAGMNFFIAYIKNTGRFRTH